MAARRAKREAIRAKYNGVASVDATPSPSSAVQPPPLSSIVSDAVTRAPSISGTSAPPAPNAASSCSTSFSSLRTLLTSSVQIVQVDEIQCLRHQRHRTSH